jgi:hypothetical protein
MNFSPELSKEAAILVSLLAASMWGTWFISLKYIRDYPLDGFFMTLFTTSIIFVWGVGFLVDRGALLGNIMSVLGNDPSRVGATLLCGMIYVVGMRFSLTVLRSIGLALAQPIQSSISILIGTSITTIIGGLPKGVSIWRILIAALVLICAVMATMFAAEWRRQNESDNPGSGGMIVTRKDMQRAIGLIIIASIFSPAYPFAISYGLRSTTHPEGLAVLPFMALLATGAFIGCTLTCGLNLTRKHEWGLVRNAGFQIHKWGIGSGLFHYGGNIIHTFATAFLSSAISWPLGITSGLWTQVWGLVYGEFKGSPVKAYVALFTAFGFYIVGAYIIASASF